MSQSNKPTGESKPQPVLMKNPLGESGMRKFSCIPPRNAKAQGVNLGLEIFYCWSKRLNGFPALESMLANNSGKLNVNFLLNYLFVKNCTTESQI
ncbi:hypothetical protein OOL41_001514 [Salmonella enterica]|nr:hypothetical protein [Salmonella enterica]